MFDKRLSPRLTYQNMTIEEAALAIIAHPDFKHWKVETDFHIDRDVRIAVLEVGRVSVQAALEQLAEAFNAQLVIDHDEHIVRFVSKTSMSFGFDLRPLWDWFTGKTPPEAPPTND